MKTIVGLGVVFVLNLSVASLVQAVSLEEFDAAEPEVRDALIANTLQAIFIYYNSNPETAHKGACMEGLYSMRDAGGSPELLILILDEIDQARADNPKKHEVEGVIYTVTERECI